jgi:hypothetical protein
MEPAISDGFLASNQNMIVHPRARTLHLHGHVHLERSVMYWGRHNISLVGGGVNMRNLHWELEHLYEHACDGACVEQLENV